MPNAVANLPRVRVLIVEDDPLDAELAIEELRRSGLHFESQCVDDEAGLRSALIGFLPDIVVSDLSLPGFSGERALDLLTEATPGTPFIYFSGSGGSARRRRRARCCCA